MMKEQQQTEAAAKLASLQSEQQQASARKAKRLETEIEKARAELAKAAQVRMLRLPLFVLITHMTCHTHTEKDLCLSVCSFVSDRRRRKPRPLRRRDRWRLGSHWHRAAVSIPSTASSHLCCTDSSSDARRQPHIITVSAGALFLDEQSTKLSAQADHGQAVRQRKADTPVKGKNPEA